MPSNVTQPTQLRHARLLGRSRKLRAGYLLLGRNALFPICALMGILGLVSLQVLWGDPDSGQIPVGQTFTDFSYPSYDKSTQQLDNTFFAKKAVGVTPHRAHAFDVKIEIYEMNKGTNSVATTITTPDADILLGDKILRTVNTVKVDRADMTATSQKAEFNVGTRQYALRQNVTILLKNFDIGKAVNTSTNSTTAPAQTAPVDTNSAPQQQAPDNSNAPVPAPDPNQTPGLHDPGSSSNLPQ